MAKDWGSKPIILTVFYEAQKIAAKFGLDLKKTQSCLTL